MLHVDEWKRKRLSSVGADYIIPTTCATTSCWVRCFRDKQV